MRVFFALTITADIQFAIERWRDAAFSAAVGRKVAATNFHITLHFLGDVSPDCIARLCNEASQINAAGFELRLNRCGYFPRAGVLWIAPDSPPNELGELVRATRKSIRKSAVTIKRNAVKKSYQPHLTLFRGCHARPPLPATEADFVLPCDEFALYESVAGDTGVRYEMLQSFALR